MVELTWSCGETRGEFSFPGPEAILNWGPFWKAEVGAVAFSDYDSAPVPTFLNPDPSPKKFQI